MRHYWIPEWPQALLLSVLLLAGCASTPDEPSLSRPTITQPTEVPAASSTQPPITIPIVERWLAWHEGWKGTPHRLGGSTRRGIDCSAYVQRGFQELLGMELPRSTKQQRKLGIPVSYGHLQAGDLVFFRPDTYPNHVGVYLGDGTFLHVSSKRGVTRSRLDSGYWRRYFQTGRRLEL
jgi:cell wall-associated NlpC family hydrolase